MSRARSNLNGFNLFCKETSSLDDSLKDIDITERNQYLAFEWRTSLTQDERDDFNVRARTTQIISRAEEIKRTTKRMKRECEKLRELDVKCTVILDDNGKGSMDVFGHPRGVKFFEESNIAGKFYAYVNGGGSSAPQRCRPEDGSEKELLRRKVRELFNEKYSQACGKSGLTVPYGQIKDGKVELHVQNLGVEAFKHPSNYGVKKLKAILDSRDKIVFTVGPANQPDNGQRTQPGNETQNRPDNGQQTQPGNETQNRPDNEQRTQPSNETQNRPDNEQRTQPGNETQNRPENGQRTQPGNETQNRPDNGQRTQPGNETQNRPENGQRTQPGNETQNRLDSGQRTRPGNETQNRPDNGQRTQPGNETQNRPDNEQRTQPGNETSTETNTGRRKRRTPNKNVGRHTTTRTKRMKKNERRQGSENEEDKEDEESKPCDAFLCQEPWSKAGKSQIKWIGCDTCNRWFHFDCVGINRKPRERLYDCGCSIGQIDRSANYPSNMSLLEPELSSVKDYLKDVLYANMASKRHSLFKQNRNTDLLLLSSDICGRGCPISNRMIRRFTNEISSFLPEFWEDYNRNNTRMFNYVLNVLLPEAIVFILMTKEACSRHAAERLLANPREVVQAELEVEDDDSDHTDN